MIHLNLSCLAIFRLAAVSHRHDSQGLEITKAVLSAFDSCEKLQWHSHQSFVSAKPCLGPPSRLSCICGLYKDMWPSRPPPQALPCSVICFALYTTSHLQADFKLSEQCVFPEKVLLFWKQNLSQAGFRHLILLLQLPKCWTYRLALHAWSPWSTGFFWDRITLCSLD